MMNPDPGGDCDHPVNWKLAIIPKSELSGNRDVKKRSGTVLCFLRLQWQLEARAVDV